MLDWISLSYTKNKSTDRKKCTQTNPNAQLCTLKRTLCGDIIMLWRPHPLSRPWTMCFSLTQILPPCLCDGDKHTHTHTQNTHTQSHMNTPDQDLSVTMLKCWSVKFKLFLVKVWSFCRLFYPKNLNDGHKSALSRKNNFWKDITLSIAHQQTATLAQHLKHIWL